MATQAFLAIAVVAAGLAVGTAAEAGVPEVAQLEGTLVTSGGGPITDGTYSLTFRLYAEEASAQAAWSEGPVSIKVVNGMFAYRLGTQAPLKPSDMKAAAWIGYQVGSDAELPRKPLASSLFALRAAVAESLSCSGCLPLSALDPAVFAGFAKSADLATVATSGAYADVAGAPNVDDLAKSADLAAVASTGAYADLSGLPDLGIYAQVADLDAYAKAADLGVYAKTADLHTAAFSGSFSDLDGQPVMVSVGQACGTGLVISGIADNGTVECIASVAAPLKPDDIAVVSNGILTNVFTDAFASTKAPLAIPDNNPIGVSDVIAVGDIGIARKLTIAVKVTNSDISSVVVHLIDPAGTKHVLHSKTGSAGASIDTSYPDLTKTVSGDLTTWIGKNPKGNWILTAIDGKYLNNTTDGQIVSWKVSLETLSTKKIQLKGDLSVKGSLTLGEGGLFPAGTVMPFNLAACPTGWVAADGGNSTPDVRGRFPMGVGNLPYGNSITLGAAGGSHTWRRYSSGGMGRNTTCQYGCYEMSQTGFGWQGESDLAPGANDGWTGWAQHLPPYTGLLFCQKL